MKCPKPSEISKVDEKLVKFPKPSENLVKFPKPVKTWWNNLEIWWKPGRSYYSFRCFSFPSADYAHDIPNMYSKAAAQALSVLSVVQKRSNLYSNVIEPVGPMLVQQGLETDPLSNWHQSTTQTPGYVGVNQ